MTPRKENTFHKHQEYRLLNWQDDLPSLAFRCHNDDAWNLTFIGSAARAIIGHGPDDLLHHRPAQFLRMICLDDRECVDAQRRAVIAGGVHGAGAYLGLKPRMRVNPCPAC